MDMFNDSTIVSDFDHMFNIFLQPDGPRDAYSTITYTLLAVFRNFWGTFLALFIINLALGFGGPVLDMLVWKAWAPLSRLTFIVYLVHPIVMSVFYLTLRNAITYGTISFIFIIAGLIVISYAVSFVIAIIIYFPLKNLLNLSKHRKTNTTMN